MDRNPIPATSLRHDRQRRHEPGDQRYDPQHHDRPDIHATSMKAATRNALPDSAFAYPATRRYPINTPARARNALARAAQPQTRGSYAHVAKAVRKKWGDRVASVGPTNGTVSRPGKRRRRRKR